MKPIHLLSALIIILVWGLNIVIGKLGVLSLPPIFFVSLRSALVGVLLLPFLKSFPEKRKTFLLTVVVFGVLQFLCLFVGLTKVDGAVAAITLQTLVPFGVILGRFKFNERISRFQILGFITAIIGIIIVAGEPKTATKLEYLALVILGAFCTASGSVLIKDLGSMSVFRIHGWIALCSFPILFVTSILFENNQIQAMSTAGWKGLGAVAFTAIGTTIIGHGLWAFLLQNLPVYRVMPINLLVAISAVVFSILLLNEPLTASIIIGGSFTILGVTSIQISRANRIK